MTRVDQAGLSQPPNTFLPPRTAVAVLRGIKGAQKRHEWLPLGPVWTAAVLARTQRVSSASSDWPVSTFLVISRVHSNFLFNFLFYSSSGGAVKSIPTPKGTVAVSETRPSNSRKLHAAESDIEDKPANQAQVALSQHHPGNCGTVAFLPAKEGTPGRPA